MRRVKVALSIVICFALLLVIGRPAFAVPPQPSSFYGTVKVNGENVAVGTEITAWINGVQYAIAFAQLYLSDTVYSISVTGDEAGTLPIEGGNEGDTIIFKIGNLFATQTGTWHSGINAPLDLTASGFTLEIISDHGTVQKNPDQSFYSDGEQVTLTAVAEPGWSFSGWSGDLAGVENPVALTMHQNMSVTALYDQTGSWLFLPIIRR